MLLAEVFQKPTSDRAASALSTSSSCTQALALLTTLQIHLVVTHYVLPDGLATDLLLVGCPSPRALPSGCGHMSVCVCVYVGEGGGRVSRLLHDQLSSLLAALWVTFAAGHAILAGKQL